jgi:spermidine synthase
MRELLSVFSGNEMVFGIILGAWLLLTGAGAGLGRRVGRLRRPVDRLIAAQIVVAVLPAVLIVLVRTGRDVVFVRGAMVGVAETVVACLILLAPYGLVSGYLLTLACVVLSRRRGPESIGQVYFLDSIGDIIGGALFTFVLIGAFGHFGCVYVAATANLALACAVAAARRRWVLLGAAVAVSAAAAAVVLTVDLDAWSTRIQHRGFRVLFRGDSPYGSLVVTASGGQVNFIENGVPLFSTQDVRAAEEAVHYAMAQRPAAGGVLLIGGGVSGTVREVLKYPRARVDYVELDPLILSVGRRYAGPALDDPRVRVIEGDGRRFLRGVRGRYDVIVVDLPDPTTFQLNRYYTVEFFRAARRALTADGVLGFDLGEYDHAISAEVARLIGVCRRTLGEVFATVLILPGGRPVFVASDGALTAEVASRIRAADVPTRYVRHSYLVGTLTSDRVAALAAAARGPHPVNADFSPVLCYHRLRLWCSRFGFRFGVVGWGVAAAAAAYLLAAGAVPRVIFASGFAGAGLEIILLVAFQTLYGSVYHRVGLIVTAFMAGLAAGSLAANRWRPRRCRRTLAALALVLAGYAAALPLGLPAVGRLGAAGEFGVLPLLTFALAAMVGLAFPIAGRADFAATAPTASRLYVADLTGGCVGAILVSTLLVPLVGITGVCLLVAGLNVAAGAALWLRRGA